MFDGRRVMGIALRLLAVALLAATAAAIGSTYVGHSSSPYGVCYGASGRSIPCAVAKR